MTKHTTDEVRMILPGDLVGAGTACDRYGIDRSTLVRRIGRGEIVPLAQLDGSGAYVFAVSDLPPAR